MGSTFAFLVATFTSGAPLSPEWNQTNGVDLRVLKRPGFASVGGLTLDGPSGGLYVVSSVKNSEFASWYAHGDKKEAEGFMRYFVRCAYNDKTSLKFDQANGKWRGELALAQASLARSNRLMNPEEKKLVSSCLLALANQEHLAQTISLRGADLPLRPGERFTMGHPEGIFLGDLFADPPKGYSMSLGLPPGWTKDSPWAPPSVALGRTYDSVLGSSSLFTYLGRCQDNAGRLGAPAAGSIDPVHNQTRVCAEPSTPAFDQCRTSNLPVYLPLFVYGPRMANLGASDPVPDGSRALQVIRSGSPGTGTPCKPAGSHEVDSCVGPYDTLLADDSSACKWWSTWGAGGLPGGTAPAAPATVRLTSGASLQVVLRRMPGEPLDGWAPRSDDAFTALVRFKGKIANPPRVWARDAVGSWQPVTTADWSGAPSETAFVWLQVHPIHLRPDDTVAKGPLSLSLKLEGVGAAPGALELNAVAFSPGRPSCCDGENPPPWCQTTPSAGVCLEDYFVASRGRAGAR